MAVNDDEWKALRGHVSSGFSRPSTVWTELKFKLMFSGWNKKDFYFWAPCGIFTGFKCKLL